MLHALRFTGQRQDDDERAVRPQQVWPTLGGIAMLSREYLVQCGSKMLGPVHESGTRSFLHYLLSPTVRASFDPGATGVQLAGLK